MNKLFLFTIILLFLTSCASNFTESYTNGNVKRLNGHNLSQISGNYKIFATREYDINGNSTTLKSSSKQHGIFKFLRRDIPNIKKSNDLEKFVRSLKQDILSGNWSSNDWVNVSFDGRTAHFELKKNNRAVKTYTIKGKIKNGFFTFPEENNCVKIPKVINGCIKSEKRIGITKDGQLLLQEIKKYEISGIKIPSFLDFFSEDLENVNSYEKVN